MTDDTGKQARPCAGCSHFFITYDTAFPYGCRAMGFKSRRYPYYEVQTASGLPCQMRQAAGSPKENSN